MDVQPQKKYKAPAYPTIEQAKFKDLKAEGAVAFNGRQKLLIMAAAVVISGTLSGCIPVRTAGVPAEPPPSAAQETDAPAPQAFVGEHDTFAALQTAVEKSVSAQNGPDFSAQIDSAWHEEPDIRAAFDEFLDWMRAEGVI